MFSCEFSKISINTFLQKTPLVAASEYTHCIESKVICARLVSCYIKTTEA